MEARLKRRMIIMLIIVGILFGLIGAYKIFVKIMVGRFISAQANQVVTVSTATVTSEAWDPQVTAAGSMRAVTGVDVTTELPGLVTHIYFQPGEEVVLGQVLVQLNADSEIGQLQSLKANLALANITYERDKAQFAIKAVSKQQLDTDYQNVKSLEGQVFQQQATVDKKTIRAPFAGRLGVSQVNPGQYLNVGTAVTTLQALDPIYVNFYLPQQNLAQLKIGFPVTVTTDVFPNQKFKGKVTTINPIIQSATRNVLVEATLANPKHLLVPNMFTSVTVTMGAPQQFITIPQAAVTYNSYGNIVYVVTNKNEKNPTTNKEQQELVANQVFITTGETRGDQVQVLKGLQEGQTIVTSGQIKLRNGDPVKVDNSVQPSNSANPSVSENY